MSASGPAWPLSVSCCCSRACLRWLSTGQHSYGLQRFVGAPPTVLLATMSRTRRIGGSTMGLAAKGPPSGAAAERIRAQRPTAHPDQHPHDRRTSVDVEISPCHSIASPIFAISNPAITTYRPSPTAAVVCPVPHCHPLPADPPASRGQPGRRTARSVSAGPVLNCRESGTRKTAAAFGLVRRAAGRS